MLRNISLLYIREHEGSSHFVPFPTDGVTFKRLKDNIVLMTFAGSENGYKLFEEDAFNIQKTLSEYTKNSQAISPYPEGFNKFLVERLMRHKFGMSIVPESRLSNILYKNDIIFVGDLVQWNEKNLSKIKGIGTSGMRFIKAFLKKHNLKLNTFIPNWDRYRPVK